MKIPDLREIAVAWARAANPTAEQQRLADARIAICDTCPQKSFHNIIRTYVCDACGCPLNKKVYSPKGVDACPTGQWEE